MTRRPRPERIALPAQSTQIESRSLQVRHFDVPVAGLDPQHAGLRIAHLTDVHVGLFASTVRIRAAIRAANEAGADLTVLTGDYVCFSPRYVPKLERVIAGLQGPVVSVLGNHDYWTDAPGVLRALRRNGYEVLRNERTRLTVRGRPLDVIGIDDAITGHADAARAFHGLSRDASKSATRLVLTHVPGMARAAAAHGPGLVLAGHTHGGQINLPGLTAMLWQAVGKPYVKGFYRVGDATLYVNSGVGTSTLPLRAGAPSEVAILTLRPAVA